LSCHFEGDSLQTLKATLNYYIDDFDEIWNADALYPSEAFRPKKIRNLDI